MRMISKSRVLSILSKHASDALKDGNIGKHYSDAYDEIENLPIMEV